MSFETAVEFVLKFEGGLVNNPSDPGKATNFGISQKAYPDEDIPGMTRERAIALYRMDYWDACRCDELPEGLALLVFDCAVNQGPIVAVQLLQITVGTVPDGIFGPKTMAAVGRVGKVPDTITNLCAERGFRYGKLKTFETFGRGWMRRLFEVHRLALEA